MGVGTYSKHLNYFILFFSSSLPLAHVSHFPIEVIISSSDEFLKLDLFLTASEKSKMRFEDHYY